MTPVEKRYANAFLEYASQTIGFENGLKELEGIKEILCDNQDFKDFIEGPAISRSEKYEVVDAVLKKYFSEEVRQFLKLLIRKDRIREFSDIEEYARVKYAHGEEVDAVLKTRYPLDAKLIQTIKDALEKKIQKKLHLNCDLDPDLLGGIAVTIGNTVIDGSARKRLEDLRQKLRAVRVN